MSRPTRSSRNVHSFTGPPLPAVRQHAVRRSLTSRDPTAQHRHVRDRRETGPAGRHHGPPPHRSKIVLPLQGGWVEGGGDGGGYGEEDGGLGPRAEGPVLAVAEEPAGHRDASGGQEAGGQDGG